MFYSKRKQSKLMKKNCKNSLIKWCCWFSHTGNDRILNAITPRSSCFWMFLFTAMGSAQGAEYDSVIGPYIVTI